MGTQHGRQFNVKSNGSYVINRTEQEHFTFTDEDVYRADPEKIRQLRENPDEINFNDKFWTSISLIKNLKYLKSPIQIHHATNDTVVDIGYSRDLAKALKENGAEYEFYEYSGGGHNIESPYFETAMKRTVEFFEKNL